MALSRQRDNEINRINKRIERVAKQLGTTSSLYQKLAATAKRLLGRDNLTTKGAYKQIKRTSAQDAIPQANIDALSRYIDIHSIEDEKKYLKQHIRERQAATGAKIKNPSKKEVKEMAGLLIQLKTDAKDAIDYLYTDKQSPEWKRAEPILAITGRQNTYEELAFFVDLAEEMATRKGEIDILELPFIAEKHTFDYLRRLDVEKIFNNDPDNIAPYLTRR